MLAWYAMKTPALACFLLLSLLASVIADAPHIVFLIGEREYGTRDTLPALVKSHLEPKGYRSTLVFAPTDDRSDPKVHQFPGLAEDLADADLLFVSVRRRMPPQADLDLIRQWVADGKPVLGVRTSSHAFAGRSKGEGYQKLEGHGDWPAFDRDVFGCTYVGHFGSGTGEDGYGTFVQVKSEHADHPIVQGIDWSEVKGVTCTLYQSRDLAADTKILMNGSVPKTGEVEPVTWIRESEQGRSFYTSLVSRPDMEREWLKQLLMNAIEWLLETE